MPKCSEGTFCVPRSRWCIRWRRASSISTPPEVRVSPLSAALVAFLQRCPVPVQPAAVAFGVAVILEPGIAPVRVDDAGRMLDRAPVFLGARGDLADIGDEA